MNLMITMHDDGGSLDGFTSILMMLNYETVIRYGAQERSCKSLLGAGSRTN